MNVQVSSCPCLLRFLPKIFLIPQDDTAKHYPKMLEPFFPKFFAFTFPGIAFHSLLHFSVYLPLLLLSLFSAFICVLLSDTVFPQCPPLMITECMEIILWDI